MKLQNLLVLQEPMGMGMHWEAAERKFEGGEETAQWVIAVGGDLAQMKKKLLPTTQPKIVKHFNI